MSKIFKQAKGPLSWIASPHDFTGNNNLGIYTRDTVQRYVLGTRYLKWDGSIFKYAQAKATLNPDLGVKCAATQNLACAAIVAAQAAGSQQVSVTFGAADGYANSGLVVENELAGGVVVIFSDTVATMVRGIVGNTGIASTGTVILYVDAPWNVAIATADSYAEAMGSEFYDVRHDSDGTHSVIGVPVVPAVSGEFSFLQTWGRGWVAPQSSVGATSLIRACYWRHDGSLDIRGLAGTFSDTYITDQYAGYVLQNAQAGTQGAPFVMFEISR